jgi:hypothetical protein
MRAKTTGGSIGDLLERVVKSRNPLLQSEGTEEKVKDYNRFGFSGMTAVPAVRFPPGTGLWRG